MGLQVFGTRKCPDTRKAERFLKERGIAYQFIDLAEKGISPGELRAIVASVGLATLIDSNGARFIEKGLAYMDFDSEEEIVKCPLLLRTPILRDGRKAIVGFASGPWIAMLGKA
jgi:Arsenate reductase and related proteins, glutaredoxin family